MRVGIVTFHFALNYGAVLQAFALSRHLESMGHTVQIVDYQPYYHVKRYGWQWKLGGAHISNLIYPRLHKRFRHFRDMHMNVAPPVYRTLQELKRNPPEVDALICGSDQVWNPELTGLDEAYFLAFAPSGVKRISYSASFGRTSFDPQQQTQLGQYLNQMHHISVREQSSLSTVAELSGRTASVVVDPTLLGVDYCSVMPDSSHSKPYVLVVNLQDNPQLYSASSAISHSLRCRQVIINNYSMKFWLTRAARHYPSPQGYLALFRDAEYVVTNSFHATVFAVLFKKRFLVTPLSNARVARNTRITDLLKALGLVERYVAGSSADHKVKRLLTEPVDWRQVDVKLETLRGNSHAFLECVLSDNG